MLHGQNIGGRGGARPSPKGDDPMENWFRMENSSGESQSLMRLEGELNATLLFEHGGLEQASTLWVARIFLGQLFCERLALGRTVKAFAKHYWK